MKIAIGNDHAGVEMKQAVSDHLKERGIEVINLGTDTLESVDYPVYGRRVAHAVVDGDADLGILICGTGIGISLAANKVPGIRAAVCHDPYSAERARMSNDAQIMCMGARVVGAELAKTLTDIWLHCEFAGGGSTEKVDRINYYDNQFRK